MGIPKFFRWLSERYPLINSEVPNEINMPEFDNFYLDMNGIIHNCTHPRDDSLSRMTESEQILGVFRYIERIFNAVKPKKIFFMAIDGSAPRAKMNQQRQRRFMAAKDRSEKLAAAKDHKGGDEATEHDLEDTFDSNCITPGTEFMARLSKHLDYFVRKKIHDDPAWRVPKIYLSGHDVPGEGEHKIMEYIRSAKSQPGYDPNTRHCLLGNDADLIMLSLVSHEPHFNLLREKTIFGGGKKNAKGPSKIDKAEQLASVSFELLKVPILRDYLYLEFQDLKDKISFPFDLERIIDDWVLMAYSIGNDFLPELPLLDISTGALQSIIDFYKELLPTWEDYMTDSGDVNIARLEDFFRKLAKLEKDAFASEEAHSKSLKNKRRGQLDEESEEDMFGEDSVEADAASAAAFAAEVAAARKRAIDTGADPAEAVSILRREHAQGETDDQWKAKYYSKKLELPLHGADEKHRALRHKYVEGLLWCYNYYYNGCASWGWFYPYHYAPLASDLQDLSSFEFRFTLGEPFCPFEQLLAVLPLASSKLLPDPVAALMSSATSPIQDMYPLDFPIDKDGKKNSWEWTYILPFIDEALLRAAFVSVPQASLKPQERERNQFGTTLYFDHDPSHEEEVRSLLPSVLPNIPRCTTRGVPYKIPEMPLGKRFEPKLCPGVKIGKDAPAGFAGIFSLPGQQVTSYLAKGRVNVFGTPARRESIILRLPPPGAVPTADQLKPLLGKRLFYHWPVLREGVVKGLADTNEVFRARPTVSRSKQSEEQADKWRKDTQFLESVSMSKQGIEIGPVAVTVQIEPFVGMGRGAGGRWERQFGGEEVSVPFQLCALQNTSLDPRFEEKALISLEEEFPLGTNLITLDDKYFGSVGRVTGHNKSKGLVGITVTARPGLDRNSEYFGKRILQQKAQWIKASDACRILRCNGMVLSKITGTVRVMPMNVDIGLGIKFDKRGMCLAGHARRDSDGKWEYSGSAIDAVKEYMAAYPQVFRVLDVDKSAYVYEAAQMFHGAANISETLETLEKWIKALPLSSAPFVSASMESMSPELVKLVEAGGSVYTAKLGELTTLESPVWVAPAQLLNPKLLENCAPGDSGMWSLGDRVVNMRDSGSIPLGLKGTVVSVGDDRAEIVFDETFMCGTDLEGRCSVMRGAVSKLKYLCNISARYGQQQAPKNPVAAQSVWKKPDEAAGFPRGGRSDQGRGRGRGGAAAGDFGGRGRGRGGNWGRGGPVAGGSPSPSTPLSLSSPLPIVTPVIQTFGPPKVVQSRPVTAPVGGRTPPPAASPSEPMDVLKALNSLGIQPKSGAPPQAARPQWAQPPQQVPFTPQFGEVYQHPVPYGPPPTNVAGWHSPATPPYPQAAPYLQPPQFFSGYPPQQPQQPPPNPNLMSFLTPEQHAMSLAATGAGAHQPNPAPQYHRGGGRGGYGGGRGRGY